MAALPPTVSETHDHLGAGLAAPRVRLDIVRFVIIEVSPLFPHGPLPRGCVYIRQTTLFCQALFSTAANLIRNSAAALSRAEVKNAGARPNLHPPSGSCGALASTRARGFC
jgi:hypothetical protein